MRNVGWRKLRAPKKNQTSSGGLRAEYCYLDPGRERTSVVPGFAMRIDIRPQYNMVALVSRIQPQVSELASATAHFAAVRTRLLTSFNVVRTPKIGSHARGTAIRQYSDLDMLAVLRRKEAKWGGKIVSSRTLLSRVVEDLKGRFRHTDIRGDQQAAAVDFASGQQSLDVVPALWGRFSTQRPVYTIPDGDGDWLETSPEAHTRLFSIADARSGGKLKGVCQLLRWWKFSRAVVIPLQTFHSDILLATSGICVGAKTYTHCLYSAFRLLASRECRAIRDPEGIAGVIPAAKREAQLMTLNNAVDYSLQHATSALALESVGKIREANAQWNLVFNGTY